MAFPTSPSNNQVHKEGDRSFVYDSTSGAWDQINPTSTPSYDSIVGGRDIQKSSGSEQIVSVPLYDRNFTMYSKGTGSSGGTYWYISFDSLILEDNEGRAIRRTAPWPKEITGNVMADGLNGMDSGSQANNKTYYVWVIDNGNPEQIGTICSVSGKGQTPIMPAGYTFKRLVGTVTTYDNGGTKLSAFMQHNNKYSFTGWYSFVGNVGNATGHKDLRDPSAVGQALTWLGSDISAGADFLIARTSDIGGTNLYADISTADGGNVDDRTNSIMNNLGATDIHASTQYLGFRPGHKLLAYHTNTAYSGFKLLTAYYNLF